MVLGWRGLPSERPQPHFLGSGFKDGGFQVDSKQTRSAHLLSSRCSREGEALRAAERAVGILFPYFHFPEHPLLTDPTSSLSSATCKHFYFFFPLGAIKMKFTPGTPIEALRQTAARRDALSGAPPQLCPPVRPRVSPSGQRLRPGAARKLRSAPTGGKAPRQLRELSFGKEYAAESAVAGREKSSSSCPHSVWALGGREGGRFLLSCEAGGSKRQREDGEREEGRWFH